MSKDKDSGINPEDFLLHSKEISDATIPKKHCAVTRDILLYLNELSVDIGYHLLPEVPEVVQVDNDTYELWSKLDTETITSDFINEVESLLREETEKEEE